MESCIYPGPHSDNMSREHFLPAGLGEYEGCPKLLNRLCEKCNRKLGDELEEQFLRVGPIGLLRWIVGLRGRTGKSPSPFTRGAAKTKAVVAIGRIKGFEFDVALELDPGTLNARPMRQIIMKHQLLGYRPFPIFDGTTKASFLAQLEVEGFHNAEPVHAFARRSEQGWVGEIATGLASKLGPKWTLVPTTNEEVEVAVTVILTPQLFYREIAKIAFHYVLTFIPSLRGDEPEFQAIRDYIWEGKGNRPVEESREQVLANLSEGGRPSSWNHFLYLIRDAGAITVYVQLFAGPRYLSLPYRVDIGKDPRRLILPAERLGHQFIIQSPSSATNVVGEMVDAQLLQKIIPVQRRTRVDR